MATVTKPLALNESLNTTEQNPRNVADVLSDGLENIKQAIEGGGSGGHTIQNSAGTDLPQEDKMQFVDSHVSDDSTNGRTFVQNIKEVSPADYASTTDEGIIVTDDGNDALIGAVSDDYVEVTADGNKTWAQLLNSLHSLIDFDKVRDDSVLVYANTYIYHTKNVKSNSITFSNGYITATEFASEYIRVTSSDSTYRMYNTSTGLVSDKSSDIIANGAKITLYYGNKKATVDLQTTANRCVTSDGGTVQQALNAMPLEVVEKTVTTDANGRFSLGSANRYFACIPKTSASACTISGYFTNPYNITYANTDKPNTELTMMCLRMKS